MAAVRGHRRREWEEPRGAPRALGQLRAQVRAVPRAPQGAQNPSTRLCRLSPAWGGGLLLGGGFSKRTSPEGFENRKGTGGQ